MEAVDRYREKLETLSEAMSYASTVTARMPNATPEDRIARAERWFGIMDEWHKARLRWKIMQP